MLHKKINIKILKLCFIFAPKLMVDLTTFIYKIFDLTSHILPISIINHKNNYLNKSFT